MIFEGLKLALIGMLVVFSFLVLLVLVVKISTVLLRPFTDKEERELMLKKRKQPGEPASALSSGKLVAVISSAVAAHRGRRRRFRQD